VVFLRRADIADGDRNSLIQNAAHCNRIPSTSRSANPTLRKQFGATIALRSAAPSCVC